MAAAVLERPASPQGGRPAAPAEASATQSGGATPGPATGPTPQRRRINRRVLIPILAAGVIGGAAFAFNYWRDQSLYVSTHNAQVTGALVQVGSVNAGRVADVRVDLGDTVPVGQALITIVDPSQLWVQAEIDESQVARVRVGQPVDVHADTLRATLPGRVLAVGGASAASFSLLPQGTTSGSFTKVAQLVPVKIKFDFGKQRLVYGTSVEVKIHAR